MQNQLRVRFELRFKEQDAGVNGVAVIQSVVATTIAPTPVLDLPVLTT